MAQNTIKLAFYGMPGPEIEGIVNAGETLLPGHIVTMINNGTYGWNTYSGEFAPKIIVVENPYVAPEATTLPIDTPYEAGDRVYMVYGRPGDVLYMLATSGLALFPGDVLLNNGDGTLYKGNWAAATAGCVVGIVSEQASGTSPFRVKVLIT
jgi:hypothetical protein